MRRCWTLGHVAEARKQWSEQAAQTALGKHVGFDACLHIEAGVQIQYEEAPKKRDIYSIEIRFVLRLYLRKIIILFLRYQEREAAQNALNLPPMIVCATRVCRVPETLRPGRRAAVLAALRQRWRSRVPAQTRH